MSIKAIIVDDERKARELLALLVKQYCPAIQVVAMSESVSQAKEDIAEHAPDLVFLDVEMPDENGFHLTEGEALENCEVIFTTAYGKYALDAFKVNASGYLTKPIVPEQLIKAAGKAVELITARKESLISKLLIIEKNKGSGRIGIPTLAGVNFIDIENIVRCMASGNYTELYLQRGDKVVVSRTLKEFEELLQPHDFMRVHRSHVVNLRHIAFYHKSDDSSLTLNDGYILPVSQLMKAELEKHLNII